MGKLKITVLSLSVLTVMSGAVVAPALGAIAAHFQDVSPTLIKLIITIPSLFIILTSFLFQQMIKRMRSKTITIIGLVLYVIGGCGGAMADTIYMILFSRMLLGIGVGLIMPLSTGLISLLFDQGEQSKLMGYSSAMNNVGGIIATILSGLLVSVSWRLGFLVYLLGLVVMLLAVLFLPNVQLSRSNPGIDRKSLGKIWPYAVSLFAVMLLFYTVPSNLSIIITREALVPTAYIGIVMSAQNTIAFITGMVLSRLIRRLGPRIKYAAAIFFGAGLVCLSLPANLLTVLIGLLALGVGLGSLVPVLNTQISLHIERERVASAMAIMGASLFLGQFLSPIVFDGLTRLLHIQDVRAPFYLAAASSLLLLIAIHWVPVTFPSEE